MTHPRPHPADEAGVDKGRTSYSNETMRLLHERSSCRSFYEDKPIPDEVMQLVLEAGCHAATGGNLQPYSIIKVTDPAVKNQLAELCGKQMFIASAPVDLIFCLDFHRLHRWSLLMDAPFAAADSFRHFWIGFQDVIIAAQNICTAADAMDLGSVYVGTVTECFVEIRELLRLPQGVFPVVLLSLGYPKHRPEPKNKLMPDSIVHEERYQDPTDDELLEIFARKSPRGTWEVNEERTMTLERVAKETHGDEFATKCLQRVVDDGVINLAQVYFGLHYRASDMADSNQRFVQIMKEAGYACFEKWQGPVDR